MHRILKSNRLKPHQSRYFLHITDPDFFPKMEHLVGLYRSPPPNLFFFDECPGIQILKRLTPDLQTDGMRKRLEEFEYIRHGTLDVLAFLHHADGKVHLECQANHKTDTFLAVFRRHTDRLRSNRAAPLRDGQPLVPSWVSLLPVGGRTQRGRVSTTATTEYHRTSGLNGSRREDKRIVIHYTPYHGSWLNWIEFWFGIMGRKVLDESFGSPNEFKAALEVFVPLTGTPSWPTLLNGRTMAADCTRRR